MLEAIDLTKRGSFVDIDTVDEDLPKWFKFYLDNGGLPEKLTVLTDASITSPHNLLDQMRACVLEHKFPFEQVLTCITANTAKVLQFEQKGNLEEGKDADLLILSKKDLEITGVIANGRRLMTGGKLSFKEKFLKESNREIQLKGKKV